MTREEAIEDIKYNIKPVVGGKSLDMAIQALTAISELSKSLKAVNRYEMDEKVLIGFNMAVAIFNNYFGEESCALKNEQTDGDLISRQAVLDIFGDIHPLDYNARAYVAQIKELPTYSAEQNYDWCNGCKEYDTEKHCCHRYSSFIRYSLQDNINAVLGDIKAEIEKEIISGDSIDYINGLNMALMIINEKHISGKEEE